MRLCGQRERVHLVASDLGWQPVAVALDQKFGNLIMALHLVLFWSIVLLILMGFIALVVWTLLTGPSR